MSEKDERRDEGLADRRRHSVSMEAARARSLARLRELTPLERVDLALTLGRRMRELAELKPR